MQYFKWIYNDEPEIEQIPGFVFTSFSDAQKFEDQFKDWMMPPPGKSEEPSLYTFNGENPTEFPLIFSSGISGNRLDKGRYKPKELNQQELQRSFALFSSKPKNFFHSRESEQYWTLFQDLAWTLVCLKPKNYNSSHVYDVEAYYSRPVKMIKMNFNQKLDNVFDS